MTEGYAESAYFSLGEAMHTVMDSTSPLHENYQNYVISIMDPIGSEKASRHLYAEGTQLGSNDKIMKGAMLIRRFTDESTR